MKKLNKLFKQYTERGVKYWMNRIGELIAKGGKKIKGYKTLKTESPERWMCELTNEIVPLIYKNAPSGSDENLAATRILSLLYTLWFYRLCRAKAYDCRRPVEVRKQIMERLEEYSAVLFGCLIDESFDSKFFPSQEWESPFVKNARYEPDTAELERQKYSKSRRKKK